MIPYLILKQTELISYSDSEAGQKKFVMQINIQDDSDLGSKRPETQLSILYIILDIRKTFIFLHFKVKNTFLKYELSWAEVLKEQPDAYSCF